MSSSELSKKEILDLVEPIMDNCLQSSNEDDHAKHVKDFTDQLKNNVTPENLEAQLTYRPRVFFTNREFVCLFRKKDIIGMVWRQSISNTKNEFVNHAIFVEIEKSTLIDHCLIC